MRSRALSASLVWVVSMLLAALPVLETAATGSGQVPAPAVRAAAQDKARTKRQKQRADKKKQQRANPEQRQQGTKLRQRRRQASDDPQPAKRQRTRQRADGVTQVSTPGRTSVPELPGGGLTSRELNATEPPGERYIVIFKNEDVDSQALTADLDQVPGAIPTNIFEYSLKGFAGHLTPEARRTLERDPRVASIIRDEQAQLAVQTLPRALNRIDAELNPVAAIDGRGPGLDVDIAIIDTGIDFGHPDLNVFAWADCTPNPARRGWDNDGHGTHVAGTAAAVDNDIGVVGVAPGARVWSMRVMDDAGNMFFSYIIDCMDIVTFHASTPLNGETIDVANMSLGARRTEDRCGVGDVFNDAVCRMVGAGITTVVAAGNNGENAANFNPANIEAVIAVSALADSDGQPGGRGGNFNAICQAPQVDDGLATFSNFGADVDLAAPGVDVLSTFPTYLRQKCAPNAGTGFEILPGTSMASPQVAGAAGLLLAVNPNRTPAQVKAALLADRERTAMPGDPDGINEGILDLGNSNPGDTTGPTGQFSAPRAVRAGQRFTLRVTASDPSGVNRVELYLCQPGCRLVAKDGTAPYTFVRRHGQPGRVRYEVRVFDNPGNVSEASRTVRVRPRR